MGKLKSDGEDGGGTENVGGDGNSAGMELLGSGDPLLTMLTRYIYA